MSRKGPPRTLSELADDELRGRTVLVRVDYNVPLSDEKSVADAARIQSTLPTLDRLRSAGARVVLVSHLGRPKGEPHSTHSLGPVAERLSEELGAPVPLVEEEPGSAALSDRIAGLSDGDIVLLENIRFQAGETRNDPELARALGELADLFVGEAFGVAHRAHASNVGAAEVVRERGGAVVAGLLMDAELRFLGQALEDPERPFVGVMGGAKISGKIDLIEAILPRVDRLLVGGAMANTFFRALGLATGRSLVEDDRIEMAEDLLDRAGEKLVLPIDLMVAEEISPDATTRAVDRTEVGEADRIADIGPRTRAIFGRMIQDASTILWNGPMGVFEMTPFAEGTRSVARAIARAADEGALSIVGGGDSASAARDAGVQERMSHISTGGGAALDLLAGKTLPGVAVLDRRTEIARPEAGALAREES